MNKEENQNKEKKSGRRKFLKVALGAGAIALLLYFFYPEVEKFLKKKTTETVTKTITKEGTTLTEATTPTSATTTIPTTTATSITTTPTSTIVTATTETTTATTRTMTIPTRVGTIIPHFPETARRPYLEFGPYIGLREKPMHVFKGPVINRGNGGATAVLDVYKILVKNPDVPFPTLMTPDNMEKVTPFPWILTPDKMLRPREVFYLPAWSSKRITCEYVASTNYFSVLVLYDPIFDPCSFTITKDMLLNKDTRRHYALMPVW